MVDVTVTCCPSSPMDGTLSGARASVIPVLVADCQGRIRVVEGLPLLGSLVGFILTCMPKSWCCIKGFGCGVWKEGILKRPSICWSTSLLEVSQSRLSRLCPGEVPVPSAGVMCSASASHLSIGIQCCSRNQYAHAGEYCMSRKDHRQLDLAIVVSRSRTEWAESTAAGTSTRPSLVLSHQQSALYALQCCISSPESVTLPALLPSSFTSRVSFDTVGLRLPATTSTTRPSRPISAPERSLRQQCSAPGIDSIFACCYTMTAL